MVSRFSTGQKLNVGIVGATGLVGTMVREILETAQQQMPQYGIELVDIRFKRIDYVRTLVKVLISKAQ